MRKFVGADDEQGADDAFDQASRGGDAPLAADDAFEVDVGVEDFAGGGTDRVALQQNLLEVAGQRQTKTQDQQQDGDAENAGDGDVPQARPAASAVNDGSLVQRGLDVQQGRQVN